MDKVLYILFCMTNSLFYVSLKYMQGVLPGYTTTEIATYCNWISFFVMTPYLIKNFKKVKQGFSQNSRIMIAAPASLFKFFAITHISPKNAMVVSFLTPVCVTLLSFAVLKESFLKENIEKYFWVTISFVGVVVFVGDDVKFHTLAYLAMAVHIIAKAFLHVFTKQLSKDRYLLLFYSIFYNTVFTTAISVYKKGSFNFHFLLNPNFIAIGFISVLCQFALIQAYNLTKKVSLLQNLDYSRIMFTSIFTFLMLNEQIKPRETIGMMLIFFALISSERKSVTKVLLLDYDKKSSDVIKKECTLQNCKVSKKSKNDDVIKEGNLDQ